MQYHFAEEEIEAYSHLEQGETIELLIKIRDEKPSLYGGYQLLGEIEEVSLHNEPIRSKLKGLHLNLYVNKEGDFLGKSYQTTSPIKKMNRATNPGQKDAYFYFLSQRLIGSISNPKLIELSSSTAIGRVFYSKVAYFFRNQRQNIIRQIQKVFRPDSAQFMTALLLGEKTELSKDWQEDFRDSGVAHVLAVSGLHMGLLALLVQELGKFFYLSPRYRFYFMVIVLVYYNVLLGLVMSALRASIMVLLLQLSIAIEFPYDKSRAIFCACCISLLWVPESIFGAGFLLSYFAVIGILYVNPVLTPRSSPKIPGQKNHFFYLKKLIAYGRFQSAILLATWPILSLYFGKITLMAFLANMLIVPFISYLYLGGVFVLFISRFSLPLSRFFSASLEIITQYLHLVTRALAKLGWGEVYMKEISFLELVTYYLFLYLVLRYVEEKKGAWHKIWKLVK